MTDKRNYTGRIEDIVIEAQEMQERVRAIKNDFLNDKDRTHFPTNDEERDNHAMAVYMLDKIIHALDTVILTREQFNELVEDVARKFRLSSVNNPSQFAQQYLSSLTAVPLEAEAEKRYKFVNVYGDRNGRFLGDEEFDTWQEAFDNRDQISAYSETVKIVRTKN